jgi:hypothetical protein
MKQYYIVEIQQYADGSYGHIVHYAYDTDPTQARLKAESKYHEVLAAAAISALPSHAAIMFRADGVPMFNQCYTHPLPEPEPEPEETESE